MSVQQAARWIPHYTVVGDVYERRIRIYADLLRRYTEQHGELSTKLDMLVLCNWSVYEDDQVCASIPAVLQSLGVTANDVSATDYFEQWEGHHNNLHCLVGTPVEQNNGRRLREQRAANNLDRPSQSTDLARWQPYKLPTTYYTAYMRVLPWMDHTILVKVGTSQHSVEKRYKTAYKTSDAGSVQTVPFLDVRGIVSPSQQVDIVGWINGLLADPDTPSSTMFYYKKQLAAPNWLELALMYIGRDLLTSLHGKRPLSLGARNEFLVVRRARFYAYLATCCHEHQLTGTVYDVGEETHDAVQLTGSLLSSFRHEYALSDTL